MEKFDIAIIGGGPGGYVAAIKAAQKGLKVVLVERERLGGLCLNWGCIPTKTLLISARHYRNLLRSEDFGITGVDLSDARIDWEKLTKRKDSVVDKLVSGIEMLFKKNGVKSIKGSAKVLDAKTLQVDDETIEFKNLIIATGAQSAYPDIPGLDGVIDSGKAIDSRGFLMLDSLPEKVLVVGGDVYAVEYATFLNAIGVDVTLVHGDRTILPHTERELARTLERQLKKDGLNIVSEAAITEFRENAVTVDRKGKTQTLEGDRFLIFLGLKPNLDGLEGLDLQLDHKGFIKTDDKMKTSISNIFAIGDVNGKVPLAHVASAEGITAVENILGLQSSLNYSKIPRVVYSFPELASVGITEEEAKEEGIDFSVGKFPLSANGMAIAESETAGFVKIISDNQYGEVIGVHMAASVASDMISKAVAVMNLEGTVYDLAKTIHPHPTFAETIMEAAFAAIDKPIHM
ncbi:dihydrolipoyl dehydrogenase [Gudongella sp. SC589]|uniref:dihydrolipoyl dehydrogenase n=1 Tax=Gudongella sp. SC589 TaxID=3385990 RepID=UPI003904A946